jgi:hypothetical protein
MLSFPTRILVITHHGSKNSTPPIPSKRDRQGTKTRGGSFFSSQKGSNPRIVWIHLLEDEKETQQHDFEKETQNIRNCILERKKNCLKKKEQNQKPTACLWTLFLFDKDSNNLFFIL